MREPDFRILLWRLEKGQSHSAKIHTVLDSHNVEIETDIVDANIL